MNGPPKRHAAKASAPDNAEVWELARSYADAIGRPHTLFTSAIRYLRSLSEKGTTILTEAEPYPLSMLLKSPSMRSVLYYSAAALRKDELAKIQQLDGFSLFKIFPPDELASVLATTYLYRKVKKICDPRIWETLSQEIQIQMETGFFVGSKIPAIGTSRGLLLGVVRYAALGLFSLKEARSFKSFRRKLNDEEKLFLVEEERERWGCDHLQIGSILLQSMGMGVPAAKALVSPIAPAADSTDYAVMAPWFAAKTWIQSLIEEERAPECFGEGSPYFLPEDILQGVQERVDSIYEMGSSFDWIDKTKEDLPKNLFDKIGTGLPEPPAEPNASEPKEEELSTDII